MDCYTAVQGPSGGDMRRRALIGLLGSGAVARSVPARAQKPDRMIRLVYLDSSTQIDTVKGLLGGLRDLGYVDGKNISLVKQQIDTWTVKEIRTAILGVLPNADMLVVSGTVGGVAAKAATSSVPVVFISVGAPVDIGLVESLARPGGNMTGISFEAASVTYAQRFQILK